MTEQVFFKNVGGQIVYTGRPQGVMPRSEDRVGGYVANNGPGDITVFLGDVVTLSPFKAVLVPQDYHGPVRVTGQYEDRFTAVEFIKDIGNDAGRSEGGSGNTRGHGVQS
jgi:hypothetical protein